MTDKINFKKKPIHSVSNWKIKRQKDGKVELSFYDPVSWKDPESVHGSTASNGHLASSAWFKGDSVILINAQKDKKDIWHGVDEDGRTYKMLIGKKYSNPNPKYRVQTVGEIDEILNKLGGLM